jgi:senataxin
MGLIMLSQADASFFATPSGATRAPLPPRPPISRPVVSLPLPLDLAKPRDLVAAVNRGPSSAFPSHSKPEQPTSIQQNDRTSEYTNDDAPDAQELPVGHERPPTSQTGRDSMENGGKARTHPPVKRPKKDKASIFIPKKPNKVGLFSLAIYLRLTRLQRPVPDGDSAGPPNARRRL